MIPVVLVPSDIYELSVRVDSGLTRIGNGLVMDLSCPSDTGLEDWQRLVENCQISRRLSSNWLKWIGGLVRDWIGAGFALWQWIV